jgi:carbon monoxide dehydrogenase subunit G
MKMNGEQLIAAPRAQVWDALNDPEVLKQCIPGCQSLERESEDRLKAIVAIKIGPIGARFAGAVTLSELDPPNSYVISGEGQGGNAGFARGGARIKLSDEGETTRLTYEVDAEVGGRLAQIGGPIVDATAKQLAGTFFKRFGAIVTTSAQPATTSAAASSATATAAVGGAPDLETSAVTAPVARPAFAPVSGPTAQSSVLPWIGAIFLAALAGYVCGETGVADPLRSAILGIAIAAVAAFAHAAGRRAGPIVVTLDPALSHLLTRQAGSAP